MKIPNIILTLFSGSVVSSYSISGIVYDSDGSTPVSGATVELGTLSTVSAGNGAYSFNGLTDTGSLGSMTCTKTGYSWTAIPIWSNGSNIVENFVNNWYATGGISTLLSRRYQPRGAASKAASMVNLVNPGTLDLTPNEQGTVTWDTVNGWSGFSDANYFGDSFENLSTSKSYVVRCAGGAVPPNFARVFYVGDSEQMQIDPYGNDGNMYLANNGTLYTATRQTFGAFVVTPTKAFWNGIELTNTSAFGGSYTGTRWKIGNGDVGGSAWQGSISDVAVYDGDIASQGAMLSAALEELVNPNGGGGPQTPALNPDGWTLVLDEQFANLDAWNINDQFTWSYQTKPENVSLLGGGGVRLTGDDTLSGGYYPAAGITSKEPILYGYFEMRAKFPALGDSGIWPSFWLFGAEFGNWPNESAPVNEEEIDILEYIGDHQGYWVGSWSSPDPRTKEGGYAYSPNIQDGNYHKIACRWLPGEIKFYYDDGEKATNTLYVSDVPLYIWIQMGIGGWSGTPSPAEAFPANFDVDYVKVWQESA